MTIYASVAYVSLILFIIQIEHPSLAGDIKNKSGKFHQKQCHMFDNAWEMKLHTYRIPEKSFCSNYCFLASKPHWFDCDKGIMPKIEFFFSRSKSCNVLSEKGAEDEDNNDCINKVSSFLDKNNNQKYRIIYITHGYLADGSMEWIQSMKDSLLSRYGMEKTVVAIVDWKHGARRSLINKSNKVSARELINLLLRNKELLCCVSPSLGISRYGIAAVNTWPIGNILAYVSEKIMKKVKSKAVEIICVGHSLGSHLCGFFGKMSKIIDQRFTLTKIVGLDPSGPIWDFNDKYLMQDPNLRLNKEDALNVEVFHTNAGQLGYKYPIGDIDFYINGGKRQPGCYKILDPIGSESAICSHGLSVKLFNAINKNSKKSTKSGQCNAIWKCKSSAFIEDGCSIVSDVRLGDLDSDNKGTYWIEVGKESDTCYFDPNSEKLYKEVSATSRKLDVGMASERGVDGPMSPLQIQIQI